ncbi:MAG: aldo/keto reductase [Gammaproteobacteria bacterium]
MQREIARTGIKVRAVGLGAMPLSIAGRPAEAQAHAVIQAFIDAGGDFIDTANVYCLDDADIGHNERLIRAALTKLQTTSGVWVATKAGLRRPKGEWSVDGAPAWLRSSCEQSLQALGSECIFLYQLHAVDPKLGLLPSLETLVDLRRAGKIQHIGLSNIGPEELELALRHTEIASVQNRCHALDQRDFRNGLVDLCRAQGVTYIAHSPVGGHFGHKQLPQQRLLQTLAGKYQASVYRIAIAWLLARGEHILPIPGASRPASILDSLQATGLTLAPEDIAAIERLGGA